MAEQLTTQQRMAMFAASTRHNMQMLPKKVITQGSTTVQFSLPKARLLESVWLRVKANFADTETMDAVMGNFNDLIRRVSIDMNNGFQPFLISGESLIIYNELGHKNRIDSIYYRREDESEKSVSYTLELPVTLNRKDLIGLILLQSQETNVTVSVDVGNAVFQKMEIEAMCSTFSIPAVQAAFPDLSVLKLVSSRQDSIMGGGQNIVKLATGTIYRKLIIKIEDAEGNPMMPADITSPIELVFNQADTPISITADMLAAYNSYQYGFGMYSGVYVFDFSDNGIPNFGGTRDLIDSSNLTELWLRFNTEKAGKITIISENISRLK